VILLLWILDIGENIEELQDVLGDGKCGKGCKRVRMNLLKRCYVVG